MSVNEKIVKLQRFNNQNQALAGVPIGLIGGSKITPIIALSMLQQGIQVNEVMGLLAKANIDPPTLTNEDWALAEDYYRSLLQIPQKATTIQRLSDSGMTLEECLRHIQARDQIGQSLVQSNKSLRYYVARKITTA